MVVKDERILVNQYLITDDTRELMQIPPEIRKCVAFVAKDTNGQKHFVGTCFFVCQPAAVSGRFHVYAVTAKHLFDGMLDEVDDVWIRLNERNGTEAWVRSRLSKWVSHPTDDSVDVAVTRVGALHESWDHLAFPLDSAVTPERIREFEIDAGEEIFLPGLFTERFGKSKNIPIIRVGNIAAMPEEKVYFNGKYLDAYLVESRSIAGLSGSPVFINTGSVRSVSRTFVSLESPRFLLLGLMKGHWDATQPERLNMGVAVVVPMEKVVETLRHPHILQEDDFENRQLLKQYQHKDD